MNSKIDQIRIDSKERISRCDSLDLLEKLRVSLLGRKGVLTDVLRSLSDLPIDERKHVGEKANSLRKEIESVLEERVKEIKAKILNADLGSGKIEISPLFAFQYPNGHLHPLRKTLDEIIGIFRTLGFDVAEGPEIETDWYNFESLNIPPDHPSRDTQDTFYIDGTKQLLRTHTSPVQVRIMEKEKPPIRVIVPGRVYRNEATDASHSAIFHQVEGLAVDENITFADLKGTLTLFIKSLFGSKVKLRFRPSHFQFTEPSAEVDIQCIICGGSGCRVCKNSGWLEMLGCGMVHPNVFEAVKYDAEKYQGFAFGLGIERFTMLRYGIDDMRLLYENNIQFLAQF